MPPQSTLHESGERTVRALSGSPCAELSLDRFESSFRGVVRSPRSCNSAPEPTFSPALSPRLGFALISCASWHGSGASLCPPAHRGLKSIGDMKRADRKPLRPVMPACARVSAFAWAGSEAVSSKRLMGEGSSSPCCACRGGFCVLVFPRKGEASMLRPRPELQRIALIRMLGPQPVKFVRDTTPADAVRGVHKARAHACNSIIVNGPAEAGRAAQGSPYEISVRISYT